MITICTPTRDVVQAGFAYDLVRLIQTTPDSIFTVSIGTILPNLRTNLVKASIKNHVSHILFIDSDMRFPPDILKKLLSHKLDIVGANCKQRQSNKWTAGLSSKGKKGIEEVKGLGFGVTLIKTEVFIKIPEPWFATPFDGVTFVGEDVFFSYKAKENGLKIYIDHDISQKVKHIGTIEL